MSYLKRKWIVRIRLANGRVANETAFLTRRKAAGYKRFMELTAVGGHKWQTPIPAESLPIWTVEIYKRPT